MPLLYIGCNSFLFLVYSAVTYFTFVTSINQDGIVQAVSGYTPTETKMTSLPPPSTSPRHTTQKYFINLKPIIISSRVKKTDKEHISNLDSIEGVATITTSPPSVLSPKSTKRNLLNPTTTRNRPEQNTPYSLITSSKKRYASSTRSPLFYSTTRKYNFNNNNSPVYFGPVTSTFHQEANSKRTTLGKFFTTEGPPSQSTWKYKFELKPPQIVNRVAKTSRSSDTNIYGTTTVPPFSSTIQHTHSEFTALTTTAPPKTRKYIFDARPTILSRWGKSTSSLFISTDLTRIATDIGTQSFPNKPTTHQTYTTGKDFPNIISTENAEVESRTTSHLDISTRATKNQSGSTIPMDATTMTTEGTTKWHHPIMWDNWSFWGPCSRSCGQGVKIRTRICLIWTGEIFSRTHLTACEGTNIDYKLCSRRRCPGQKATFREEQCHAIGKNSYRGKRLITWKPVFDKDRPCDLNCQADVRSRHYNFGSVQDGTRCHATENNVCIDGQCKVVGCDGIIESPVKTDRCGVCGGENDTCTFVHGTLISRSPTFQEEFPGYYELITIPRGSRHFKVLDNSRNNIALMDNQRNFVINGNRNLTYTGTFTVAGTNVKYIRSGVFAELLEGVGPLTEDIHIMLLYRQKNHEVKYEFWKPNIPTKADDKSTQLSMTTKTSMSTLSHSGTRMQTLSEDQIWKMLIEGLIGPEKETKSDVYSPTKSTIYKKATSNKRKNEAAIYFPSSSDLNFKRKRMHKKNKFDKKNCKKCPKVKDRNKHFCESDFVTRIRVRGAEIINRETRYDVIVLKNYKNGFSMMSREYLWVPNVCKCPKLKIGVDFLVMGRLGSVQHREIRLEVTPQDYVRRFKARLEPKLHRMKRKLKCK